MSYYNYYKPKKKKVDPNKQIEKLRKKDPDIQPVIIEGRKIAKTWWGTAWIQNLESYADYSNRIGRGKSYVRTGSVVDMRIHEGHISALVQGTRAKPYSVDIHILPINEAKWKKITKKTSSSIDSIEALLEGKFPDDAKELLTMKNSGLFPSPKEISFDCSCPDWANMCKHVAAVLYGVGARLDDDPSLLFKLRKIDINEIISKSLSDNVDKLLKAKGDKSRVMDEDEALKIFDL